MKKINRIKSINTIVYVLLLIAPIAFADSGETPVSEGMGYFLNAMFGATGISIATVALGIMFVACLFKQAEWSKFIVLVAAIGGIFGASAIVTGIVSLVHNT
jgi:type IV secretory pathway VirB2 component (pilin)